MSHESKDNMTFCNVDITFRRSEQRDRTASPRIRAAALLSIAVAATGTACADLALEPNQIPETLAISPEDARVRVGDVGAFSVTVRDADGQLMPGPPSWAPPAWDVSDPSMVEFGPGGDFTAVDHGEARVGARAAGLVARTTLLISPSEVLLSAPAVYLNQAVQNLQGSVPLIAGRKALLRVFVTGDEVSYYEPRAYAEFVREGQVVHTAAMGAPHQIPDQVDERWLFQSFNAEIPGEAIQPGTSMFVEMDPDGVVPRKPGSQSRIPAQGALELNVVELPTHRQTLVPVIAATDPQEQIRIWAQDLDAESEWVRFARSVLPIGDMQLTVREAFYTSVDLASFDGWVQLITDIRMLRAMEGSEGYYYGAFFRANPFGIGGLGYIGFPVSIGLNVDNVFAHEVGHNMSLFHAPCGNPGGPDPSFPYRDGGTGAWGWEPAFGSIVDPEQHKDVMSYCDPSWISDYSFVRALDWRIATEVAPDGVRPADRGTGGNLDSGTDRRPPEKTLLLRGRAVGGELALEPAFVVDMRPVLPDAAGPYRLEGRGPAGRVRFALDFALTPLELGGGDFLFAVPYDAAVDGALDRVVLSGPEGELAMGPSTATPTAIVLDRESGRVRAILRDWSGGPKGLPLRLDASAEILVSSGLPDEVSPPAR